MEGADDLIRVLSNLQSRANSKKTTAKFSWAECYWSKNRL
jgi:hypothetical protein